MVSTDDSVLALIPTVMVGLNALLHTIGLSPYSPLAGGVIAMGLMVYALFVNPPKNPALGPHQ
jgi:hypothetical protein